MPGNPKIGEILTQPSRSLVWWELQTRRGESTALVPLWDVQATVGEIGRHPTRPGALSPGELSPEALFHQFTLSLASLPTPQPPISKKVVSKWCVMQIPEVTIWPGHIHTSAVSQSVSRGGSGGYSPSSTWRREAGGQEGTTWTTGLGKGRGQAKKGSRGHLDQPHWPEFGGGSVLFTFNSLPTSGK